MLPFHRCLTGLTFVVRLANDHLLEIDDDLFPQDEQILIYRLIKAVLMPNICRTMDIEDELLSEIEKRDTIIMKQDKMIEDRDNKIKGYDKIF